MKLALEDLARQNEIPVENARLRDDVERITRHDLKTPLQVVIQIPGMLIDDGNLSQDEEALMRMLEIINHSLDLDSLDNNRIRIHNRGEVPVEIRDRFFDKFVTSGKRKGSGLGTYTARLMAEAMAEAMGGAVGEAVG